MKLNKIVICSTVHPYDDPRIFHRQAVTLSKYFNVKLFICAPFNKNNINSNLIITGLPQWNKKLDRLKNISRLSKYLLSEQADIFLFHDPELLPLIPFIKIFKHGSVIYDIHENYKEMIKEKLWIPKLFRRWVSSCYFLFEKIAFNFIDMVWYPVEDIGNHYSNLNKNKKLLVRNIPQLEHFKRISNNNTQILNQFIYIGNMVEDRGIKELIEGFALFNENNRGYRLLLVGPFLSIQYKQDINNLISSLNLNTVVKVIGKIPYQDIPQILSESKVGLLNFLPTPNNMHGLPNKLFEYMAVGLPVIVSNFPNYKNIVEFNRIGICVDPTNRRVIASALERLVKNEKERNEMGVRGKKLVENIYNWEKEGQKIIDAINGLLSQ